MNAMNEQFWLDVIEAYRQVDISHERSIDVERDGRKAAVFYDKEAGLIVMEIEPWATQTREARIVPA